MGAVNPGAVAAPKPSTQHPLEGLGLDTNNTTDVAGLMDVLGSMPGAAEANAAVQAQTDQQFAQNQQPVVVRSAQGTVTEKDLVQQQQQGPKPVDPAQAFNEQFDAIQADPEPPQEVVPEEDVAMKRQDYDFLVGLIQDQGLAIQGYVGGQTSVTGPSSIPVNTIVTPGFQPEPSQPGPQVAPLAVPEIELKDISEKEFEDLTTDRSAMAKFLHERDKTVAATVTQQLAATVLPTVFSHINKQMESQRAVDSFLNSNPDLAANPQALHVAVQEAKAQLPYANVDRLLYYAAQRLRTTMGTNKAINASVHDHRGAVRGRRAPVIDGQRPDRVGGQNLAQVNPFDVLKADMLKRAEPGQGDILRDLGIA